MPSPAQISANRINAQASTGPASEAGKAASSRNATTLGLFSQTPHSDPEERELCRQFSEALFNQLTPTGDLEEAIAHRITAAAWRVRRCDHAEAGLTDFDEATDKIRRSLERARTTADRLFHRNLNELRKLQTERLTRGEIAWDRPQTEPLGESRKVLDTVALKIRLARHFIPDPSGKRLEDFLNAPLPGEYSPMRDQAMCGKLEGSGLIPTEAGSKTQSSGQLASFCKNEKPTPQTPRNAPCPCNSGEKYKRCCGKQAPPVLGKAA